MQDKSFYKSFEDKYRGSRELIKQRLSVYLPFVLPLKKIYINPLALDIGCGRCEWLEILSNNSIDCKGVDIDYNMLNDCKELKLNIIQGDGIEYLKKLQENSLNIISAFHLIEHISFDKLNTLIQESLRVLKPGGILILETPNPENISVSTEKFYLDPTHNKPIPHQLLSFLLEYSGFFRVKTLRLQESTAIKNKEVITLLDIINEVSPDYGIVAQKTADENTLKLFNKAFKKEYGLSLNTLIEKFDKRLLKIEERLFVIEDILSKPYLLIKKLKKVFKKIFRKG